MAGPGDGGPARACKTDWIEAGLQAQTGPGLLGRLDDWPRPSSLPLWTSAAAVASASRMARPARLHWKFFLFNSALDSSWKIETDYRRAPGSADSNKDSEPPTQSPSHRDAGDAWACLPPFCMSIVIFILFFVINCSGNPTPMILWRTLSLSVTGQEFLISIGVREMSGPSVSNAWSAADFLSDSKTWQNSNDAVGLTKLGTYLKNVVKDFETAESVFRRSLDVDPGMNAALLNLGSILTNVKQDFKVIFQYLIFSVLSICCYRKSRLTF